MSSFTRGAFAEPRWRSTVILLAAFMVLSSGALSRGYGGSASPIEGGERLDRRQIFQSQRPIRALLPRALVTQRLCNMQPRARRKEKAAWRVSPLAQNEPSTPIGECGGAHNWPALAAIEMDDPVRTCVSM
jgi:hypothetical protein